MLELNLRLYKVFVFVNDVMIVIYMRQEWAGRSYGDPYKAFDACVRRIVINGSGLFVDHFGDKFFRIDSYYRCLRNQFVFIVVNDAKYSL